MEGAVVDAALSRSCTAPSPPARIFFHAAPLFYHWRVSSTSTHGLYLVKRPFDRIITKSTADEIRIEPRLSGVFCFRRNYAILYVVMQVVELMKTHVVKTTPEATLGEAVDLMDLYQVGSLPVVDVEGRLCGMLSESDVMRALLDNASPLRSLSEAQATQVLRAGDAKLRRVADYMTQSAIPISEHADIQQAARMLFTCGLKRLPVTDEHNRVVGALNRIDIIQSIFEDTISF